MKTDMQAVMWLCVVLGPLALWALASLLGRRRFRDPNGFLPDGWYVKGAGGAAMWYGPYPPNERMIAGLEWPNLPLVFVQGGRVVQ